MTRREYLLAILLCSVVLFAFSDNVAESLIDGNGIAASNSTIQMTDGGSIITTANGNLSLLPHGTGIIVFGEYTRHVDVPAGAAFVGATAPDNITTGTARCLGFDASGEAAYVTWEVPDDWAGATDDDVTFKVYWHATSGDAVAENETIKWNISYRVIDFDNNEAIDSGTVATGTVTYTGGAGEVDKKTYESLITMDADETNQALVKDQVVVLELKRDTAVDDYSGQAIMCRLEFTYGSVGLPQH
jgi:hypothetical protein